MLPENHPPHPEAAAQLPPTREDPMKIPTKFHHPFQRHLLLVAVAGAFVLGGCKSRSQKAVLAFTGPESCGTRSSAISSQEDSAILEQGPSCPQSHEVINDEECKKLTGNGSCIVHGQAQKNGPSVADYCVVRDGGKDSIDAACSAAALLARRYVSQEDCKERGKLIYRSEDNADALANSVGSLQTCRFDVKTVDPTDCVGKLHANGLCTVKLQLGSGESSEICVRRDGTRMTVDFRCTEGSVSTSGAHRIYAKLGAKYDDEYPAKDLIAVEFTEKSKTEPQYTWIRKVRSDADRILNLLKGKAEPVRLTARLQDAGKGTWHLEEILAEGHGQSDTETFDDSLRTSHIKYEEHAAFTMAPEGLVMLDWKGEPRVIDLSDGRASPLPGGELKSRGPGVVVDGKLICNDYLHKNLVSVDIKDGTRKPIVPVTDGYFTAMPQSLPINTDGDVAWFQTNSLEYDDRTRILYTANIRDGKKQKLSTFGKDDRLSSEVLAISDSEVLVAKGDGIYGFNIHGKPDQPPRRVALVEIEPSDPWINSMVYAQKKLAIVDGKGVLVVDAVGSDAPKRVIPESECGRSKGRLVSDGKRVIYLNPYRNIATDIDITSGKTTRLGGWGPKHGYHQSDQEAFLAPTGGLYWLSEGLVGWTKLPAKSP